MQKSNSIVYGALFVALIIIGIGGSVVMSNLNNASSSVKEQDPKDPTKGSDPDPALGMPATVVPDVPKPAEGTGNVQGRVLWNSKGAEGIEVIICTDFSSYSGCKGTPIKSITDKDGYYLIKDVTPGEYSLAVKVFDTKSYLYITEGIMSAKKYTVKANDTTIIREASIFKSDLKLIGLKNTVIKGGLVANDLRPVLKWEAYTDADYYRVFVYADKSYENLGGIEKVKATEFQPSKDLVNCKYTWHIEAYNGKDVKIAESDDFTFTVTGAAESCATK